MGKLDILSAIKGTAKFDSQGIYGQCWSRNTISDAMWRIYSNGTDGFRIRTTVRKLLASLKDKYDPQNFRVHIGKVQYLKDRELVDFAKTHFSDAANSLSEKIAEAYMVKRRAFVHEKEVRLIFLSSEIENNIFRYEIEPNDFIDQIMIHPQLNDAECEKKKSQIRQLGFTGKILKSMLYRQPRGFNIHIGT